MPISLLIGILISLLILIVVLYIIQLAASFVPIDSRIVRLLQVVVVLIFILGLIQRFGLLAFG